MADLEKVIKAFEQCWEKEPNTRNCDDCPYKKCFNDGRGKSCADRSHLDALALLKEQQTEIEDLRTAMQSMIEGQCVIAGNKHPKIIQCKDCDHWDRGHTEECENTDSVCWHNGRCAPDFYCADGERAVT